MIFKSFISSVFYILFFIIIVTVFINLGKSLVSHFKDDDYKATEINYESYHTLRSGQNVSLDLSLGYGMQILKIESDGTGVIEYQWYQPQYIEQPDHISPWLQACTRKEPPPPKLTKKRLIFHPGLEHQCIGNNTAQQLTLNTISSRESVNIVKIHLKAFDDIKKNVITFWTRKAFDGVLSYPHRAGFGYPNDKWYPGQQYTAKFDYKPYLGKWYATGTWVDAGDLFTYDLRPYNEFRETPSGDIFFCVRNIKNRLLKLPNGKTNIEAIAASQGKLYQLPAGQLWVMTGKWIDDYCVGMVIFKGPFNWR